MAAKPPPASPGYRKAVDGISRAIAAYFAANPTSEPKFQFPPAKTVFVGDLSLAPYAWAPNKDGLALIEYVDKATNREGTLLQFQVCYEHYLTTVRARA